jgi:DNA mismatch endonuclease (patch repair protein)
VFRPARVAVFVDGCFWHGCPEHYAAPRTNPHYWAPKIARNRARDEAVNRELGDAGWTVVRVWEHENVDAATERVVAIVRHARGG